MKKVNNNTKGNVMVNVHPNIKAYLDLHADGIIAKMKDEFDSHAFINELIQTSERDYILWLVIYMAMGKKAIFRTVNSQIGLYLSQKQDDLDIEKRERVSSLTVKGTDSENQEWKKKTATKKN
jgi:hypothetical protein